MSLMEEVGQAGVELSKVIGWHGSLEGKQEGL